MRGKTIYILYNIALFVASPVLVIYLLWRLLILGKSREGFGQRIGILPPLPGKDGRRIWVHAVSVGEAVASRPILQELTKRFPDMTVVLSTTTPAGHEIARKSIPEADALIYFPLDLPPFVGRALNRVRPCLVVTVETELWPNFFHLAHARGIRTAVVNGRIAGKTLGGARKFGPVYRWVLSNLDLGCMQSQHDSDNILSMGADPSRIMVIGNTKFDQPLPADASDQVARLRTLMDFPDGTDVFVAGSTNPGEDEPVLDAYLLARKAFPELRLLIAPRQIDRAAEIVGLAASKGLQAVCRSALTPESTAPHGSAVVLDTIGELAVVYGLGTVSFVGGSLIPKGGHNILQPLAWGKPVFFGPHMHKSMDSAELALSNKIGFQIADAATLADGMVELLKDRRQLSEISDRALGVIEQNRGAANRTVEALTRLLEPMRQ